MANGLFWPGETSSIVASTTTANVTFSKTRPVVRFANTGTVTVYVTLGDSSVTTSPSTGMPILPGTVEIFSTAQIRAGSSSSATYWAAITESGTARINATVGEGEN